MSGFGIAHNEISTDNQDYKTKRKDDMKKMIVDDHEYEILIPSGTQDVQMENCQKPDKFGPVYDKLRETHADKLTGGIKLPELPMEEGDDDKLTPHIRAIRQAFVETGKGWGSGTGCKFWYKNLYTNYPLFLNIRPIAGHIVRAKAGKKAACEKVAAEEPPAEKVAAEEPPAQKVSSSSQPAPKPSVSKRGPNTDSMGRISVEFILHDKKHYAMERGVNRIFFFDDWREHDRNPQTHYPTQIGYIEGPDVPPSGEPCSISVIDGSKQRGFEYVDNSGYHMMGGKFIYPLKPQYKLVITKSKEEFEQEKREAEYKEFVDSLKEVTYNGHKLYYAPYNERWHQFPLYDKLPDDDGDLVWKTIGDYDASSAADIPDPTNDDNWAIQYHGYNPDSSDEEGSDQEHHQEIPKEWRKQISRSKKLPDGTPRPYWVNINDPNYNNPDPNIKGESTWDEPPEVKAEREQQEKFDREYDERERKLKESKDQREAEEKRIKDSKTNKAKALRERMMRRAADKGGKRKTKRRQNAGSGKRPTTKKSGVSWKDEPYAKRFPGMASSLVEKGLGRAAPSIKKGPTPGEPWDIENQLRTTPIKSAIKNNKGTTPPEPIGLPRPHGLGGRKRTKRRNNQKKKRTIKRRK